MSTELEKEGVLLDYQILRTEEQRQLLVSRQQILEFKQENLRQIAQQKQTLNKKLQSICNENEELILKSELE